jgi:hypothetical protein
MADNEFVIAVPPGGGEKRRVPKHYLNAPFNFKLPPSKRQVREPATPATAKVTEPATPENDEEASA